MIKILNKTKLYGCLLLLLQVVATAQGQQKRMLTPDDYKLWSFLYGANISTDGRWVSYHVKQQDGKDTLYVKSNSTDVLYVYPAALNEHFSSDAKWLAYRTGDSLTFLNLQTGKERCTGSG